MAIKKRLFVFSNNLFSNLNRYQCYTAELFRIFKLNFHLFFVSIYL
jgi:hypothetical protein